MEEWQEEEDKMLEDFLDSVGISIDKVSFTGTFGPSEHQYGTLSPSSPGGPKRSYFLGPGEGLELNLSELRYLPRNLCTSVLIADGSLILPDHLEYWRCTGAFLSQKLFDNNVGRLNSLPLFNFEKSILTELLVLIDAYLMYEYVYPSFTPFIASHSQNIYLDLPNFTAVWEELGRELITSSMNKYFHPHMRRVGKYIHYITVTMGFSLLEGLVKRKCKELNNDGSINVKYINNELDIQMQDMVKNILEGNIFADLSESEAHLLEGIRLWEARNANQLTREALVEVDLLSDIDTKNMSAEDIILEVRNLSQSHRYEQGKSNIGTHGSGRVMSQLATKRNDRSHWATGMAVSPLITTTLCCLVFWDVLDESEFGYLKDRVRKSINKNQATTTKEPMIDRFRGYTADLSPKSFYTPTIPSPAFYINSDPGQNK